MSPVRRGRWIPALSAVLGVIGALVVLGATHRGGPGLSPDSAGYLSAAQGLVKSHRFEGLAPGDRMAAFAPLYPVLLTPGEALGAPIGGARLLGSLALGLLVAAGTIGAARIAQGVAMPVLAGGAILLAVPVIGVASFVWSDLPFSLVVSLFLLAAAGIGTHRHGAVTSGALAAVAMLLRYTGVTVLPVGILAILLWSRARVRDCALFLGISIVPPAIWVTRNVILTSTPAGHRHSASNGLKAAGHDTLETIGQWLDPGAPRAGVLLALMIGAAALLTARRRRPSRLEVVSGIFVASYVVMLVDSEATVALDPVDDRLLVPIFVPLVWIVTGTASRLGAIAASRHHLGIAALACGVAFAAWAWVEASRYRALLDNVSAASRASLPRWAHQDERRALAISHHVYSNAPDVIFLRTGMRSSFSPHERAYRSDDRIDELTPFRRALAEDASGVLVWFEDVRRPSLYTPSELAKRVGVERVSETESATLFRLTPRPSTSQR